ncbi:MAG: hypothetical protein JSS02_30575 [Planctomycetes bacterium]|nr:hypothetical protein [Planctomycetota bacterium]
MKTEARPLTPEEADSRAVLEHAFKGKPVDPAVVRRIRSRAQEIREEMLKGEETNFTLDLLDESRNE